MKRSDGYRMTLVVVGFVTGLVVGGQSVSAASTNQPPIADAGSSRYAATDPVQLDGTGSYDPDGSGPLSYRWRQISGPSVVVVDANAANTAIRGPDRKDTRERTVSSPFIQTDEIQECEFELVVSDGELTSLPDTVKVIIVPDFGGNTLRHVNPPFDRNKPTVMFFGGGNCLTGGSAWTSPWPGWGEKENSIMISAYRPDPGGGSRTYYRCGDAIIVYLSSVAPDYKQPIQSMGHSTGADPAMDVGIHLNRVYSDARYAVNRVTQLDAACRWNEDSDFAFESAELFLTSAVDGEQCWIDEYYGWEPPHRYFLWPDELVISLGLGHVPVLGWYRNSLTGYDTNNFNNGLVAGAYWSVIGPGKNLQLAPTDAYYFRWDGDKESGGMSIFDKALHPGRLPEPVTLLGPVDVGDPNGAILACEESENAVGYQLLFGSDPYRVMDYSIVSDTPAPPNEVISTLPFEKTWWTVRVYDEYGSTIYADPKPISIAHLSFSVENMSTGRRYAYIQDAINDAAPGDEIVIGPGTYHESISLENKNLKVRSTNPNDPDGVAATVIYGVPQYPAVTFSGGEEASCVLAGFTITGGIVGISFRDASPTIRNCTIESDGPNSIEFWYGGEPTIINCTILGQIKENDPRLIAHWKLDEAEGDMAYDSADIHDCTVYGGPLWLPDGGAVDGALQLDGADDYVSAPFVLDPSKGPFSVFAWIKGGVPGQVIVSQLDGANWLLADPAHGYLMTDIRAESGRNLTVLVSETVITDGDWHRVGLVWDGTHRFLYA
ncbi:hypothetical protein ACFL6U_28345, partial [Planctomycetota bacterium]